MKGRTGRLGLLGYGRVGKDSVGRFVVPRFHTVAIADKPRAIALDLNPVFYGRPLSEWVAGAGWDAVKSDDQVRRYLQALTTTGRKHFGRKTFWLEEALEEANRVAAGADVCVTDVRLEEEVQMILRGPARMWPGEIWVVTRPGVGPANEHETESYHNWIHKYPHTVISNDGTLEDLERTVERALAA